MTTEDTENTEVGKERASGSGSEPSRSRLDSVFSVSSVVKIPDMDARSRITNADLGTGFEPGRLGPERMRLQNPRRHHVGTFKHQTAHGAHDVGVGARDVIALPWVSGVDTTFLITYSQTKTL